MEKPKRAEALAYYKILKRITKSMLEQVNKTQTTQKEYKEYIESWVHEIKFQLLRLSYTVKIINQKWPIRLKKTWKKSITM